MSPRVMVRVVKGEIVSVTPFFGKALPAIPVLFSSEKNTKLVVIDRPKGLTDEKIADSHVYDDSTGTVKAK